MDYYVLIMKCLSFFGVLVLALSIYLMIFVRANLNSNTRFAIFGHNVTAGICQISLTFGTIPVFLLPCPSGYPNGVLTDLGMGTMVQARVQVFLIICMAWFVCYLAMLRVFAIGAHLHNNLKDQLQIAFGVYLVFSVVSLSYLSVYIVDYGDEGRLLCIKTFASMPPAEVYLTSTIFFVLEKDPYLIALMCEVVSMVLVFGAIAIVSAVVLVRKLRAQARGSCSSKFQKFQKDFTLVILVLTMSQVVGLLIPAAGCIFSVATRTPFSVLSSINFISLGTYPLVGCVLVLVVTPAYKSKLETLACTLFYSCKKSEQTDVVCTIPNPKHYVAL